MADEINLDEQRRVETIEEIDALPLDTESVFVLRPTDLKVKILSRLTSLKVLFQDGSSKITDDGLAILGKMTSLEVLDLEWSESITDRGLQFLYGLASLHWLDVGFCRLLTPEGVSALRSALPGCEIIDYGIRQNVLADTGEGLMLAGGKGKLIHLFSNRQFRGAVLERFPELRSEVDDDDGIHVLMSILQRTIMEVIESGDLDQANAVLAFVDGLLDRRDLDPEIVNAVSISFVDPQVMRESVAGQNLWNQIPERVRRLLVQDKN